MELKKINKKAVDTLPNEVWKQTKYPKYFVSTLGRVKSVPVGNPNEKSYEYLLHPNTVKGYYNILIYNKSKFINIKVHRLVAETFIPNPNNYICINHKDENKLNNNVENLEWCSYSHNSSWSLAKRIVKINPTTKEIVGIYESARQACIKNNISANCNNNILFCCNRIKYNTYKGYIWRFEGDTDYTYPFKKRTVIQYDKNGNFIKEFNSVKDAAKYNNIKECGIYRCLTGKSYMSNGFKWKYNG